MDRINVVQGIDKHALVKTVMHLWVPQNGWNFLTD